MSTCPICDQGILQIRSYGRDMLHKGVNLSVEGLQFSYCPECGAEVTSPEQLDQNAIIIRNAFVAERERVKRDQDLLTGGEIRRIREFLGITQKQASRIFGGGPTAFAKYEAEDVVQSAGMDKLIRLSSEVPTAAEWLFERAGEPIGESLVENLLHLTRRNIYNNPSFVQKTKIPNWFAEDVTTKHGQFDMKNAVYSSCNDGVYLDAA